jgi:hypothetical protein
MLSMDCAAENFADLTVSRQFLRSAFAGALEALDKLDCLGRREHLPPAVAENLDLLSR